MFWFNAMYDNYKLRGVQRIKSALRNCTWSVIYEIQSLRVHYIITNTHQASIINK